jgi:predicted DNA-binding transcriptional regulator YafY
MSKHGTIRRYTLIIEKISRKQYPSFKAIKDYLFDQGFEVSARTIQRDIEQIRFEFGIEIKYDRLRNGYFIDEDSSINIESFLRFLEIVSTADLLTESLKDSKDTLNYITFESQGNLKGIENLKSLLFAIRNHRKISFSHENFETGKTRKYSLKPYILREYQNRWYVIGIIGNLNEFRTFGIDRIENLEIKSYTFEPDKKKNPIELFENIVGLTYAINKLEEVILSFTPLQGKYIKALPLHKSQEIIVDNEKELVIKLRIIPNFEFEQKILMLGDAVKVIEPEWLAEEIKNVLQNSLKKYK